MCTVTYLPIEKDGFILTSNRDENRLREPSFPPRKYTIEKVSVFFPKDARAGGTWIATANNQFTLCLLNGAFVKHQSEENFKKSRGLVLLDFFQYNDVQRYAKSYNFRGIEPFTLIIVHSANALKIHELRWDGQQVHLSGKDPLQSHVWSSATLYEENIINARQEWFRDWCVAHPSFDQDQVLEFHRFGGTGDIMNDCVINRNNEMLTVSITSIQKNGSDTILTYDDLLKEQRYNLRII